MWWPKWETLLQLRSEQYQGEQNIKNSTSNSLYTALLSSPSFKEVFAIVRNNSVYGLLCFVCSILILPVFSSFNNCSHNFSKFSVQHVYWLHFMFTCEHFLQDLTNGLYSDWAAKMLCSSCLVPRTLGTNSKHKKHNCVLHSTTEIVSGNHRTEALVGILRGFCFKYPPVWQGICTNRCGGCRFPNISSHSFY